MRSVSAMRVKKQKSVDFAFGELLFKIEEYHGITGYAKEAQKSARSMLEGEGD